MSEVYYPTTLLETQLCSARYHIQPSTLLYHGLVSTPFLQVFIAMHAVLQISVMSLEMDVSYL